MYYNKFDSSLNNLVSSAYGVDYADDTMTSYALKAGLSYKGINGTVAFSQTSDDDVVTAIAGNNIHNGELVSGLGNGADLLYTDAVISSPGYTRDTKAYLIDLNYDVTAAANLGVRYVEADNGFTDEKASYTSLYGSYKFESLKGFKLGAEYETKGKDADGQDLWVKANYKF